MSPDADSPDGIFRTRVHHDDRETRVEPFGELDLATARQLEEAIHKAMDGDCRALVLDLGGLSFIDSSGVRLVANSAKRARETGIDFSVVAGPPNVHRVFELTGLVKTLPFR